MAIQSQQMASCQRAMFHVHFRGIIALYSSDGIVLSVHEYSQ